MTVARRLSEASEQVPYDISERLRAARMRAVSKRHVEIESLAESISMQENQAVLRLGGGRGNRWSRLAAFLPLIALLLGLFAIVQIQDEMRADELAEIDAELLTDELPPSAYTDPGFLQFLRSKQAE